ncbi:DUF2808 domain-containing protein [Nostoc sp. PCC 7107]|uniref:DUF2808 domain-containing protein n=1 Tax=Nostoc sp. PCC 7107 TaxID=317936 RepID=UPI00029EF3CB|nr:peptidase C14 caspase catalytic subunit p20 [Nostoc sp. PCC 7107]
MLWQKWQLLLGTAALLWPLTFSLTHPKIGESVAIAGKAIAQNPVLVQRQQRTALIIGNANYKLTDTLANPVNDATDIAKSLEQLGFKTILLKDANLRQMEEAIENFNRHLRQGGVGLFYFAGHGIQVDGENYLIPVNARLKREQDVRYEAMPVGKVLNVMEDAANDANFIILDACRNNPFASRQWRSLQRGLAAPTQAVKGTLIAYATAPGKVALDGDGRNSPYTTALLRHMKTPSLDVEQMFKQVRTEVLKTTGGKQTPWESSSLVGSFAFNQTNDSNRNNLITSVAKPQPSLNQPPVTTSSPQITPAKINSSSIPSSRVTSPNEPPPTPAPSPRLTSPKDKLVHTPVPSALPNRISFVQHPRLVEVVSTYNQVNTLGATYYFTIQVPKEAGTTLQKITINQHEGLDDINFQLKNIAAFEGTRSEKGKKLSLRDISKDQNTRTVSITFDPPVNPGTQITIALYPEQNPQREGVYFFGVTAFPTGEQSNGQFLDFGILHFYKNTGSLNS